MTIRSPREHIIMIGANHLSALYIKLVRSYSPNRHRVIAVLDDEVSLFGRRIVGVPVVSTITHVERTIEEFEVHGVSIDRIIVGGDVTSLSEDSLAEVERICHRHNIELQFVPHLLGLDAFKAKPNTAAFQKSSPHLQNCRAIMGSNVSSISLLVASLLSYCHHYSFLFHCWF